MPLRTVTISVHNMNRLAFITKMGCVCWVVQIEFINIIQVNFLVEIFNMHLLECMCVWWGNCVVNVYTFVSIQCVSFHLSLYNLHCTVYMMIEVPG
jgi:hypothetical protein